MLLGRWEESSKTLVITRRSGQTYNVKNNSILAGGHVVYGVETVGKEVHVLTGPRTNKKPNRRVKFSDSGGYKGSSGL
jgi:hypothetical protein